MKVSLADMAKRKDKIATMNRNIAISEKLNHGDKFSIYPIEIQHQIQELFETVIASIDMGKIYSIVMLGSTPRGELTFKLVDGHVDIQSDYEFVIIYERSLSKAELQLLDEEMALLVEKWAIRSPLFHIDYGVASKAKFRMTPPTFWAFEVKRAAVVIWGGDATKLLPEVTIRNLDFGVLNELILVRLWNMLICVNEGFVQGRASEYEEFVMKISYARNALDILSIFLPNQGVLLPGYKSRIEFFIANYDHDSQWGQFGTAFVAANGLKLSNFEVRASLLDMQSLFIDGYFQLLSTLTGISKVNNHYIESIDFSHIFNEKLVRKIRRKFMDWRLFSEYYHFSINKVPTLYRDDLRPHLVAVLLFMHQSIDCRLDEAEKSKSLKIAFERFKAIANDKKIRWSDGKSFFENWVILRLRLFELMKIWFYGRSRESFERIEKLMEWHDQ